MRRPRFKTLWLSTASLALAACLSYSSAGAANLLANPSFETGGGSYTGWFTFGSSVQISTPATDNIYLNGTAAAKIYGQFTGCPGSPTFNVGGFGQAFPITAGRTYEFSGYSFVSGADPLVGTDICNSNRLIAKLVYFNAASGGSEIQSNEIVIASGLSPHDQWVPFTISSPAPAAAQRVEALFLYLQPGCDAGAAFVDEVRLEMLPTQTFANSLANPSFSSGLTGWSTFGNVFSEPRSSLQRTRGGGAKLFSTFVANSPSGMFQNIPASPGQNWELSAYALNTCLINEGPVVDPNDNVLTLKLVFRDAASNEVGSSEITLADKNTPLGTWTPGTTSAIAPTGTASVDAFILFVSPSLYGGSFWVDDVRLRRTDVVGVPGTPSAGVFELRPVTPNPANGPVRIDYALATRGKVDVTIYDITGRLVRTLFQGEAESGPHSANWDGRAAGGRSLPAGVYRCVVRTAAGTLSRSMVLTR